MTNENKKVKVKIAGYSNSEESREFEILQRKEIEKIIEELNIQAIGRDHIQEVLEYDPSITGTVRTYLDVRDGKIKHGFLMQNTMLHPFDSFYEIILFASDIQGFLEVFQESLISDEERISDKLEEYEGDEKEFIIGEYGEEEYEQRKEVNLDNLSESIIEFQKNIAEQLEELYLNQFTVIDIQRM